MSAVQGPIGNREAAGKGYKGVSSQDSSAGAAPDWPCPSSEPQFPHLYCGHNAPCLPSPTDPPCGADLSPWARDARQVTWGARGGVVSPSHTVLYQDGGARLSGSAEPSPDLHGSAHAAAAPWPHHGAVRPAPASSPFSGLQSSADPATASPTNWSLKAAVTCSRSVWGQTSRIQERAGPGSP